MQQVSEMKKGHCVCKPYCFTHILCTVLRKSVRQCILTKPKISSSNLSAGWKNVPKNLPFWYLLLVALHMLQLQFIEVSFLNQNPQPPSIATSQNKYLLWWFPFRSETWYPHIVAFYFLYCCYVLLVAFIMIVLSFYML